MDGLVNRYQQTIASQVWGYARTKNMIQDLVHDVFVEAYRSLPTYRGQRALFIGGKLLFESATSTGSRRSNVAQKPGSKRTRPRSPSRAASDGEAMDAAARLYRVLDRLSPRDRAVITLIHLEERTVAEAADLLGWSQAMVKVQAFRARRKLKLLQEAP